MFDFLDLYPWLLPLMIFFGRIIDVTLGTMRIILFRKEQIKSPHYWIFEVFIWVVVISQILVRANDLVSYLSYAAGYATGNYIGILLEQRIAYGIILCRIYTRKNGANLINLLKEMGYGATIIPAKGSIDKVDIVETVVERKEMKNLEKALGEFDPNLFYIVEDLRSKQTVSSINGKISSVGGGKENKIQLAENGNYQSAAATMIAKFTKVNTLPCTKIEPTIGNGDSNFCTN